MSVRHITHGRFDGLRVQRTIGGVPIIKSWSFRVPETNERQQVEWREATEDEKKEMMAQAEKYDSELALLQKSEAKERLYDPFSPTKRNNTGIRGLNFAFRKERDRLVEVFSLTLTDSAGQMHNRYHRIDTLGYEEAWSKAIDEIGELKNLSKTVIARMKKAIPDHELLSVALEPKNEPVKRKRVSKSATGGGGRAAAKPSTR